MSIFSYFLQRLFHEFPFFKLKKNIKCHINFFRLDIFNNSKTIQSNINLAEFHYFLFQSFENDNIDQTFQFLLIIHTGHDTCLKTKISANPNFNAFSKCSDLLRLGFQSQTILIRKVKLLIIQITKSNK